MAKIMLVEDDNNLREIYEARLLAEGYEIISAHDGEEALALAVKEKPDLIISDVMMPKISGFDMLDILRSSPETKHTKVIMMTALSQMEDKDRADRLGADRYLVKSQVTLEDVIRVTKEVLEDSTSTIQSAPEPLAPLPTTPITDTPSQDPVLATSTVNEPISPTPNPALSNIQPAPEPNTAVATPDPAVTTPTQGSADIAQDAPAQPNQQQTVAAPPADQQASDMMSAAAATTPDPSITEPTNSEQTKNPVSPTINEEINHAQSATAEQSVIEQQIENFIAQTPTSAPLEAAPAEAPTNQQETPVATPTPPPEPTAAPPAAEPSTTSYPTENTIPASENPDANGQVSATSDTSIAGKKVIQPINDPTVTPDLGTLLEKEQEKEDLQNIMGTAGVVSPPQAITGDVPAQQNNQNQSPQDPNMIAL